MDIEEAQRPLGEVDMRALKDAILAQEPEAWVSNNPLFVRPHLLPVVPRQVLVQLSLWSPAS